MGYILVTGSNGFVGSKLIDMMLTKGYRILGLSTSANKRQENENYVHIKVDITQCIEIESIFQKYNVEAVIHLAAIAHLKNRKNIDWNEFYRVNTLASKSLFNVAIKYEADVFFSSTVDVYGDNRTSLITEEDAISPISNYAKSKAIAEKELIELANSNSVNYGIGRFAPIYDREYMKDPYKRIYIRYPNTAFKIGKGKNYHFVSVNSVVDFIMEWIVSRKNISGIYNVCDNDLINSIEFIKLEQQVGNSKKVIYLPNFIFGFLKPCLKIMNALLKNEKLLKIDMNLHKLLSPAKYSVDKMNSVYRTKWNLKNTVYEDV